MLQTTICYIFNENNQVLLQHKAKGFGQGKWNGPGGKIEENENEMECIIREVKEETGISIMEAEKIAKFDFIFAEKDDWNNQSHVFLAKKWEGELTESDEGKLEWFNVDKIPFDEMWEDDKIWLRDVLKGIPLRYRFYFDKSQRLYYFKNLSK